MSSRNLIEKALLDSITEESIDGLLLGTAIPAEIGLIST